MLSFLKDKTASSYYYYSIRQSTFHPHHSLKLTSPMPNSIYISGSYKDKSLTFLLSFSPLSNIINKVPFSCHCFFCSVLVSILRPLPLSTPQICWFPETAFESPLFFLCIFLLAIPNMPREPATSQMLNTLSDRNVFANSKFTDTCLGCEQKNEHPFYSLHSSDYERNNLHHWATLQSKHRYHKHR